MVMMAQGSGAIGLWPTRTQELKGRQGRKRPQGHREAKSCPLGPSGARHPFSLRNRAGRRSRCIGFPPGRRAGFPCRERPDSRSTAMPARYIHRSGEQDQLVRVSRSLGDYPLSRLAFPIKPVGLPGDSPYELLDRIRPETSKVHRLVYT